jgi:4-amino-4-deoxy-L-arabinose transferase-like glycosyltransferase
VSGTGSQKANSPENIIVHRLLVVLFGLLMVLFAYYAGRDAWGSRKAGLLAAMLVAISPTLVTHSRYVTPNIPAAALGVAAIASSLWVLRRGTWPAYAVAGLSIGLAASSKYNVALVAVALLMAHVFRNGRRSLRDPRIYVALGVAGIAFLATTPAMILDTQEVLHDLRYEAAHYRTGHAGMEGDSFLWYLAYLLGREPVIAIAGLAGIALAVYRRNRPALVVATFAITYLAFISTFTVHNDRTLLTVLPVLAIVGAGAVSTSLDRLAADSGSLRGAAATVLLIALLTLPLQATVASTITSVTPDGRESAHAWIVENLYRAPRRPAVAVESFAPYMDRELVDLESPASITGHTLDWYRARGTEYFVFSEGRYARYFDDPDRYATWIMAYEEYWFRLEHVVTFDQNDYEVHLYRMPDDGPRPFPQRALF